jgi:protease I
MNQPLRDFRIAILSTMGVEEIELTAPRQALDEAGAQTELVSPQEIKIRALEFPEWRDEFPVDVHLSAANPSNYDALYIPGGIINPDLLRLSSEAVQFVQAFFSASKPVAAMCHAPWLLIEAEVVRGRTLTSWGSLRQDLLNAGANWVDQAVVIDNDLITCRNPGDIPAFASEMIEVFAKFNTRVPMS